MNYTIKRVQNICSVCLSDEWTEMLKLKASSLSYSDFVPGSVLIALQYLLGRLLGSDDLLIDGRLLGSDDLLGTIDGRLLGSDDLLGMNDGRLLGSCSDCNGGAVGAFVGAGEGLGDGGAVGAFVGASVGEDVGGAVGTFVGASVGAGDGGVVGSGVGTFVGAS
eukprot:scaffold15194_cov163-Skeletonema_menzelii.AAC.1